MHSIYALHNNSRTNIVRPFHPKLDRVSSANFSRQIIKKLDVQPRGSNLNQIVNGHLQSQGSKLHQTSTQNLNNYELPQSQNCEKLQYNLIQAQSRKFFDSSLEKPKTAGFANKRHKLSSQEENYIQNMNRLEQDLEEQGLPEFNF